MDDVHVHVSVIGHTCTHCRVRKTFLKSPLQEKAISAKIISRELAPDVGKPNQTTPQHARKSHFNISVCTSGRFSQLWSHNNYYIHNSDIPPYLPELVPSRSSLSLPYQSHASLFKSSLGKLFTRSAWLSLPLKISVLTSNFGKRGIRAAQLQQCDRGQT